MLLGEKNCPGRGFRQQLSICERQVATLPVEFFIYNFEDMVMKKLLFTALLAFVFSAFGWAEDLHMKNVSTTQPAADAQLTHQKDDNGNVKVNIHFYHLARPDSLTPAKDAYVVWIEPNGQPPQNMGTIKVNDNLESEFQTRTPFKVFKVYVTAEQGPKVTAPSSDHILEANIDRD
jgi:hypothetical protein